MKYAGLRALRLALLEMMYENVSRAEVTSYGKTAWTFTHAECGTEQTWTDSNLTKQLDLHPTIAPCKKCGAKRRTDLATAAFVAKYGMTDDQVQQWADYSRIVRKLTERTYKTFKAEINPLNLDRGLKTNHLDHKFSIVEGFLKNIDPKIIASKENLQMLSSTENISKGRKCQTASSF